MKKRFFRLAFSALLGTAFSALLLGYGSLLENVGVFLVVFAVLYFLDSTFKKETGEKND